MLIKINNWENYNARKDVKKPSWFRLNHDFIEDHEFFSFNHEEKFCWIYFLSLASKKNTDTIQINFDHALKVCNISKKAILSCLEKLIELNIVTSITSRTRNVDVTDTIVDVTDAAATLHYNTIHNNTLHKLSNRTAGQEIFNFEEVYKNYPRKEGKAKAFEVLKKTILTKKQFDDLNQAVLNYSKSIIKNQTDPKFIKQFSSFIGPGNASYWTDWINPTLNNFQSPKGYVADL